MLIRQFLEWYSSAPGHERVEATELFCEAFHQGALKSETPAIIESVLMVLLDDDLPSVRQVLSRHFHACDRVPRAVIIGLCQDSADIATPVLMRSPVLDEGDLIDCLRAADAAGQAAIAGRGDVSARLADAIAAFGCREAAAALLANPMSEISAEGFAALARRFGRDSDVRAFILARDDLPLVVRHSLVIAVSEQLIEVMSGGQWLASGRTERLFDDARQKVTIELAHSAAPDEVLELVQAMRRSGDLTPAVLLRGLLCGDTSLFEAALVSLTGISAQRVRSLIFERNGAGLGALYRRAKMPLSLEPAFRAAIEGASVRKAEASQSAPRLDREIIQRVLIACDRAGSPDGSSLIAMLRRFEAEAAKGDAKIMIASLAQDMLAPAIEMDQARVPLPLLESDAPVISAHGSAAEEAADAMIAVDFAALEHELAHFVGDMRSQGQTSPVFDLGVMPAVLQHEEPAPAPQGQAFDAADEEHAVVASIDAEPEAVEALAPDELAAEHLAAEEATTNDEPQGDQPFTETIVSDPMIEDFAGNADPRVRLAYHAMLADLRAVTSNDEAIAVPREAGRAA